MLSTADKECLIRLRARWRDPLRAAAEKFGQHEEILAGIMMRETRGGESKLLRDVDGIQDDNPADDTGDFGHGHGLMQVDDRSFPAFCASEDWKDPWKNVAKGAQILRDKYTWLASQALHEGLSGELLERAAIAAYNCGEGNVLRVWRAGLDLDSKTAGQNYSKQVLEFAEFYGSMQIQAPAPAPGPPPAPAGPDPGRPAAVKKAGMLAGLWQLIMSLMVSKRKVGKK